MPLFTSEIDVISTAGLTDAQLRATPVPVDASGTTVPVSVAGSVAVTGPLTDTQLRATPVPISGTVSTTQSMASTATITRVVTSSSSVLLLAANASRKKAIIMTETGTANYVALAATATATSYTYLLGTQTALEINAYTGPISLIRSSGSGNVQVTELV